MTHLWFGVSGLGKKRRDEESDKKRQGLKRRGEREGCMKERSPQSDFRKWVPIAYGWRFRPSSGTKRWPASRWQACRSVALYCLLCDVAGWLDNIDRPPTDYSAKISSKTPATDRQTDRPSAYLQLPSCHRSARPTSSTQRPITTRNIQILIQIPAAITHTGQCKQPHVSEPNQVYPYRPPRPEEAPYPCCRSRAVSLITFDRTWRGVKP